MGLANYLSLPFCVISMAIVSLSIAIFGSCVVFSIGRNPEASSQISGTAITFLAMMELVGLLCFVLGLLVR